MGAFFLCWRNLLSGFIVLASIALLPKLGQCQVGRTAAQFLLITPDARGKSLGDGGSVFSKGAVSAYYNPALLVTSKEFSGEYNYCQYLPQISDDLIVENIFLSSNYRDLAYLGIGYTRFDYSGKTDIWEDVNSYDYSLGFWTAISFDPDNSIGVGIKYIKMKYESSPNVPWNESYEGSSYAFDFGFLTRNHLPGATWRNNNTYYPVLHRLFREERDRGFSFGISVANWGKDMALFDEDRPDPLPRKLRLGTGYQAVDSEPIGLRLTVDATKLLVYMDDPFKEEWSEIAWSYGVETTFYYILNFRLGRLFDRGSHQRLNTIGFGIGPEWLRLDYSRVLGDIDDWRWNRRTDEYSFSISCNISPQTFEGN